MKANPYIWLLLRDSNSEREVKLGDTMIKSSKCESLLCIKIDNKLNFNLHVESLCKNTSSKMHALARITPYMNLSKNVCF